nr:DUF5615 family PIN-like protein [Flavobacterium sp. SaA2.13]
MLFDQNISFRIISKINIAFPEAKQVRQLQLENATDVEIWEFARINDYTIITFDSDFFDFSNIKGHPPKIIWLRLGNTTTEFLANLINDKAVIIKDFISKVEYTDYACLEIK